MLCAVRSRRDFIYTNASLRVQEPRCRQAEVKHTAPDLAQTPRPALLKHRCHSDVVTTVRRRISMRTCTTALVLCIAECARRAGCLGRSHLAPRADTQTKLRQQHLSGNGVVGCGSRRAPSIMTGDRWSRRGDISPMSPHYT